MEKELVWVDKSIVEKLDIVQDICRIKGEDIEKLLEKIKNDDNCFIENIDDSLIEIKCHAKRIRDEYKNCVDEEIEKSDKLWEDCDNKISESRSKVKDVTNMFYTLESEIDSLHRKLDNLELYKLDSAINLLERYNHLSENDKDKIEMLLKVDNK